LFLFSNNDDCRDIHYSFYMRTVHIMNESRGQYDKRSTIELGKEFISVMFVFRLHRAVEKIRKISFISMDASIEFTLTRETE
jgi:hypothetical protein